MKKTKHSEEKIIAAVKQLEAGRAVKELAREMGVTDQTLYNWKSKYGGMDVSDAKRLKSLEDENRRLKGLVADLSLDKEALTTVIRKRLELVSARRDVALVMAEHAIAERYACRLLEVDRSTYRYEPRPDRNAKLREALWAVARQQPRYGYRRLWALLVRQMGCGCEAHSPALQSRRDDGAAAEAKALEPNRAAEPAAGAAESGMGHGLCIGCTGNGACTANVQPD